MRNLVLGITLVLAFALPGMAAELAVVEPGSILVSIDKIMADSTVGVRGGNPSGYEQWLTERKAAKALQRSGFKKMILGASAPLLAVPLLKSGINSSGLERLLNAAGIGMSAWGTVQAYKGLQKMSELNEEAALKGYYKVRVSDGFAIAPTTDGGVKVRVALSF